MEKSEQRVYVVANSWLSGTSSFTEPASRTESLTSCNCWGQVRTQRQIQKYNHYDNHKRGDKKKQTNSWLSSRPQSLTGCPECYWGQVRASGFWKSLPPDLSSNSQNCWQTFLADKQQNNKLFRPRFNTFWNWQTQRWKRQRFFWPAVAKLVLCVSIASVAHPLLCQGKLLLGFLKIGSRQLGLNHLQKAKK